jgi:4-nitrophenyl phosphatase
MGYPATETDVYATAYATAQFIGAGASAFVIGEQGLYDELKGVGIAVTEDERPDWVVVGICRRFTYELMDEAQRRIRNGARFLATNRDEHFPDSGGRIRPGAGALVAAVAASASKQPDVVIGKPEPTLIEMILRDADIEPTSTLVVGDQPSTDILCAHRTGCDSALVLTGVTDESSIPDSPKATYVLRDLAELCPT